MNKRIFGYIVILISSMIFPQEMFAEDKPAIIVQVVVDGIRYDNFVRYSPNYSDNGFLKLINGGTQFRNNRHSSVSNHPFVGVASIVTGATPSQHGIIGNRWINYTTNVEVDMFRDGKYVGVGTVSERGAFSPKNIMVQTIGDLLKDRDSDSKVISIAHDYKNAIIAGGSNPTDVYWLDSNNMWWATNSYYRRSLPKWLEVYNRSEFLDALIGRGWEPQIGKQFYFNNHSEILFKKRWHDEIVKAFDNKNLNFNKLEATPQLDDYLLKMAELAIEKEGLGDDEHSDLLILSLSGMAKINSNFGINSQESEDAYYNLDRNIGDLNDFLSKRFGKNGYVLIFTGSCGTSNDISEDKRAKSGKFNVLQFKVMMNSFLASQYGEKDLLVNYIDGNIYLNRKKIFEKRIPLAEIRDKCATFALQFMAVSNSYTADTVRGLVSSGGVQMRISNSFYPKFSGDVLLQLYPNWVEVNQGDNKVVSSYGSAYDYDVHVPLIFFGKGIVYGDVLEEINTIDIAPTIGAILKIGRTDVSQGNILNQIIDDTIK